jgi:transposase InsO family protein
MGPRDGRERRARTPRSLARAIGQRLEEAPGLRGSRAALARELGVTTRTLWNWREKARRGAGDAPLGRPARAPEERARAKRLVAEEWERQGVEAGWRPIAAALGERAGEKPVPRRLVEEALRDVKAVARRLDREQIQEVRRGVEVLLRDAIWGEDAAYVGRAAAGRVEAEVVRDPAPGRTISLAVGWPAADEDVVALLEGVAKERGGWPLVLQTDRGGAYRGGILARRLEAERVVHLLSRPRTPTDNAQTERAIGELRRESGVGGGGCGVDVEEVREAFARARRVLDEGRRWARHGYRLASDVDAEMPRADRAVERERFYREATEAMAEAGRRTPGARAAWRAQREALFEVMERHELVHVRRGVFAHAGARGTRPAPWARTCAPRDGRQRGPVALAEVLGAVLEGLGLAGAVAGPACEVAEAPPGRDLGGCARTPGALCSG